MDLAINAAALVAAMLSLAISGWIAFRQYSVMNRANQLPMIVDLIRQIGSTELMEKEEYLLSNISRHDPKCGVSRLPKELRQAAAYVTSYYLTLAYLAAYKVVDKTLVALPVHYRLERVWTTIEPYVKGERELRGSDFSYMNFLEDFVIWVRQQDIPNNPDKFRIHGFLEGGTR
ncbi:DUF4760 domain-containing protein [Micromonospora zamorensis]|uniref:DUF4760 domain-containing protein n=1 Tax=Micromonospora zamorensis TaxID=709883 RepID=UPI0033B7D877